MMDKENEALKKKITEVDKKIDTVSFLLFSYIQTILGILNEKELMNPEEFTAYLEKSRQELLKMGQDAQFREMMKEILPGEKENPNA